jgi:lysyl-tRNA synthetase class 1
MPVTSSAPSSGAAADYAGEALKNSNAWPFQEAERIHKRIGGQVPAKGYVLFETGYGPSGLPHVGTFGEAVRTVMVRLAFSALYPDVPTRLYCVSDDMDGLRKVPDNIPNPESVAPHLGKPLTAIPDPFGTHESFGAHMNARLCAFMDGFGFDYCFVSSTENYRGGVYDSALLRALERYDEIMRIMLPTLGEERRRTYSPFMPICPETGIVLQAPTLKLLPESGSIVYRAPGGEEREAKVTGGACKLQWKPDWGMRWAALDVDYEMYGKDLQPSVDVSSRICKAIGGRAPEGMMYELFLDDKGEKISKSKGNGLSLEEWLRYAPQESLAYYMYREPKKAKKLHFDVIPKAVDEFLTWQAKIPEQDLAEKAKNPAWHAGAALGDPERSEEVPVSFNLLLNLAGACHAESAGVLWGFVARYAPGASPETHKLLDRLAGHAVRYYKDFVAPYKSYRIPSETERDALRALKETLLALPAGADAETIQTAIYETGTRLGYASLKDWFGALYGMLLGQESGPRLGSFVSLYGIGNFVGLIEEASRRG